MKNISSYKSLKTIAIYTYWFNKYLKIKNLNIFIQDCQKKYSLQTQKVIIASIKHFLTGSKVQNLSFPKSCNKNHNINVISKQNYFYLIDNLYYESFFISERNREMIKVLWFTGLRINELLNLKWNNVIGGIIFVNGKGGKKRQIPYKTNLFARLKNIQKSQYVFCKQDGNKLTYSTIIKIFQKIKKMLYNNKISAHTFRHSFATRLLKNGLPLSYISNLLGHSSISTTSVYLHFNIEEIRKEMEEKDWS